MCQNSSFQIQSRRCTSRKQSPSKLSSLSFTTRKSSRNPLLSSSQSLWSPLPSQSQNTTTSLWMQLTRKNTPNPSRQSLLSQPKPRLLSTTSRRKSLSWTPSPWSMSLLPRNQVSTSKLRSQQSPKLCTSRHLLSSHHPELLRSHLSHHPGSPPG